MDQAVRKRVVELDATEMQKSEIKVKKFARDSEIDVTIDEKIDTSSDSDSVIEEDRIATITSMYTDQEASADPLCEESSADPLCEESSADPLCEESSADPLCEESSADPLCEESSADPLQLNSNMHDDSQTGINSDRDVRESNVEESENCNKQESNNPNELEEIKLIRQWVISCSIPHEHVDKLLKILKDSLIPSIPVNTETLLQSHDSGKDHVNGTKNKCYYKELNMSVPVIDVSNIQSTSDFETFVLAQLALQQRNIQRIENKIDKFAQFLVDTRISEKAANIDFKTKYNLSFPMNDKDLFLLFDKRLKTDRFLQSDLSIKLSTYVDKTNYSISKSYLAMIRGFITKHVAMQFTASRHSKENSKDIFKSTNFYECMRSVMLSARNKTSLTTTNAELMSSLSDVLSNARKWNDSK